MEKSYEKGFISSMNKALGNIPAAIGAAIVLSIASITNEACSSVLQPAIPGENLPDATPVIDGTGTEPVVIETGPTGTAGATGPTGPEPVTSPEAEKAKGIFLVGDEYSFFENGGETSLPSTENVNFHILGQCPSCDQKAMDLDQKAITVELKDINISRTVKVTAERFPGFSKPSDNHFIIPIGPSGSSTGYSLTISGPDFTPFTHTFHFTKASGTSE